MIHPLLDRVIHGVFASRRKRSGRALRYLTGQGGWGRNPATLLTAAGVTWGVYESLQQPPPDAIRQPSDDRGVRLQPDPPGVVPSQALRLVRLAISAARADGTIGEGEHAAILQQAKESGVADVIADELSQPRPLADVVEGVTDPAERATLYVLAFTVLRADEQLSGAERIYLAQLAHLLGLSAEDVQRLETDVGERIDALGDQGQLGG